MNFEKFAGTDDAGKRVQEAVIGTTASQGSRADAHRDPADGVRFGSFEEEYEWLIKELARTESALTGCSSQAFAKAEWTLRREARKGVLSPDEADERLATISARMGAERDRLAQRKRDLQIQITLIKPRMAHERKEAAQREAQAATQKKFDFFGSMVAAFGEMTALLTEIRDLLQERREE